MYALRPTVQIYLCIWSFYQMADVGQISRRIFRKLYKIQVLVSKKTKRGLKKSFNSIFGKIDQSACASEDVLFELIGSKCLPILFSDGQLVN